jgi:hypothetical protein
MQRETISVFNFGFFYILILNLAMYSFNKRAITAITVYFSNIRCIQFMIHIYFKRFVVVEIQSMKRGIILK